MIELSATHQALQQSARELAQKEFAPRAAEIDRSEQYPWKNVELLTQAGFMGMTIPEAYGGQGLGYLEAVLVIEEMAKVCGVTGRIVVEANMGAIGAIMKFDSEAVGGETLVTVGPETPADAGPATRAVVGGTGRFGHVSGEVEQVTLGHNASEGVNATFTFALDGAGEKTVQAPEPPLLRSRRVI
jgi:alkylation response protein AidB-like acyl-CoA dehydrogenase